jgi:hypothetical protein
LATIVGDDAPVTCCSRRVHAGDFDLLADAQPKVDATLSVATPPAHAAPVTAKVFAGTATSMLLTVHVPVMRPPTTATQAMEPTPHPNGVTKV